MLGECLLQPSEAYPCRLLTAVLSLVLLSPLIARADVGDLVQGDSSFSINHDVASGKRGLSYDVNVAVAFFNFGLTARRWDGNVIGWNGQSLSSEVAFYYGVGVLNIFEVQRGTSSAGKRTRIRALIPLVEGYPYYRDRPKTGILHYAVALTPFLETAGGKEAFGIGLVVGF